MVVVSDDMFWLDNSLTIDSGTTFLHSLNRLRNETGTTVLAIFVNEIAVLVPTIYDQVFQLLELDAILEAELSLLNQHLADVVLRVCPPPMTGLSSRHKLVTANFSSISVHSTVLVGLYLN